MAIYTDLPQALKGEPSSSVFSTDGILISASAAPHCGGTGKQAKKPVWIQVQERDDRHDLRAQADSEEMQRTEHGSVCSFRRPN